MKIGHVLAYPYHGGIQEYVFNLAKEQGKKNDVTVFTSRSPDIKEAPNVLYRQDFPFLSMFRNPFVPTLLTKILTADVDILHVHFPFPLTSDLACLLGKLKKCPVVATYHCDIELSVLGKSGFLYRRAKNFNDVFLISKALEVCNRIIVTTQSFFETSPILKRFAHKVDIVPAGVDINRFEPSYSYPSRLLFVGRLIPEKGVEYLIKSLRHFDGSLVIVGKSVSKSYLQGLLKLTKQLGLLSRVHFAGFVTSEELPKFYADAGALVLPSISRLEAFGIVVLEGFASGKPVIVTDLPGPSSLVANGCGMVVPKKDPEAIAKAASWIFDSDRALEIGKRARKCVEEDYSWIQVSKKVEAVYHKALYSP